MYSRRTVPQLAEEHLPYAAVFSSPRLTNLLKEMASPPERPRASELLILLQKNKTPV